MTLPLDVARCQGRIGRSPMGSALVGECVACQRFTDRPVCERPVPYMPPPKLVTGAIFAPGGLKNVTRCPSRIDPPSHDMDGEAD